MEYINIIAAVGTILVAIITLLGSIYGIIKFLLKDITKQIEIIEKAQNEFREYMKTFNQRLDAQEARMDGVYHLMLLGKYELAQKKLNEKI